MISADVEASALILRMSTKENINDGFFKLIWKENGRTTIIEYNGNSIPMDAVEELFLTEKYSLTKGIILLIRNNGKKIELPSQMLRDNEDIRDTAFYTLFQQLLAENPQLKQEKDIHGNLIDCWYKK